MKQATEKEKYEMNAVEYIKYYEDCEAELFKQPQLTIVKSVADELDELIEEAYSSDSIHVWSDYFDYYEYIKQEINKEDDLYKFMYPKNRLLGTANRNKVILYLTQLDLVKVVDE